VFGPGKRVGSCVRQSEGVAVVSPSTGALAFRVVAIAEACSWAGLLAGMFFKYVVVFDDIGVNVFGPIHGALFIAYVVVTLVVARTLRWRLPVTLIALAASIPPLATLWFERRAHRQGMLAEPVAVA
jgi:integral membrane protein